MTTTEVTVAYVNPPKGNARSATIKDTGGAYYGIDPKWQSDFSPGVTYKIEYETDPTGKYRNVKRYKAIGGAPTSPGTSHAGDPGLAERIFVCGAVNATLGNPTIDPLKLSHGECLSLVRHWRDVWANTFGSTTTTKGEHGHKDDMSDEIPW